MLISRDKETDLYVRAILFFEKFAGQSPRRPWYSLFVHVTVARLRSIRMSIRLENRGEPSVLQINRISVLSLISQELLEIPCCLSRGIRNANVAKVELWVCLDRVFSSARGRSVSSAFYLGMFMNCFRDSSGVSAIMFNRSWICNLTAILFDIFLSFSESHIFCFTALSSWWLVMIR